MVLFVRAELHFLTGLPIVDLLLAIIFSCRDKMALIKKRKTTPNPNIFFLFLINFERFHSSIYTFLRDIRGVYKHVIKQQAFGLFLIY